MNGNSLIYKDTNWYLNLAVNVGDVELAERLLTHRHADVNFIYEGNSVLQIAVTRNDIAMVRLLIRYRANLNPSLQKSLSPLWTATVEEFSSIVELLISSGADVNERMSPFDVSFLHMAAASGNVQRVRILLDHGADVNAVNGCGKSVLQYALIDGSHEVCQLLLERGANVNAQDEEGMSVLHQAASMGDDGLVKLLLAHKADAARADFQGSNALHYATVAVTENSRIAELLLEHGSPVDGLTTALLTPLHCALAAEKEIMVDLLLRYGADVNAKSKKSGAFPLLISVQLGNTSLVRLLLAYGANINDYTRDAKTALHAACMHSLDGMVEILLKFGADINAVNSDGLVPLAVIRDKTSSAATTMVKQIARLEAEGATVSEGNLQVFRDHPHLGKFYEDCANEIARMKIEKLADDIYFSYYYVFTTKHSNLVALARNKDFVKTFEARNYMEDFPNYAKELGTKFERARQQINLMLPVERKLQAIFSFHLPDTAIRKIAEYVY